MTKAAPRDRQSTSTAKIAALLVSVSFVNIAKYPFPRRSTSEAFLPRAAGSWWGSWPTSREGQVAVLRHHAASTRPRNEGSILLSWTSVCAPWHKGSAAREVNELLRTPCLRSSVGPGPRGQEF